MTTITPTPTPTTTIIRWVVRRPVNPEWDIEESGYLYWQQDFGFVPLADASFYDDDAPVIEGESVPVTITVTDLEA